MGNSATLKSVSPPHIFKYGLRSRTSLTLAPHSPCQLQPKVVQRPLMSAERQRDEAVEFVVRCVGRWRPRLTQHL